MLKNIMQDKECKNKGAQFIVSQSMRYLLVLQQALDRQIDSRLVNTFFDLFVTILRFRNRSMGLLLSELGASICGFDHAPAGTKRISNLLRSAKWSASVVDDFFFENSQQRVAQLTERGKRPLALWDDSCVEKPESWFAEGLCSVCSSKGKRLTKIKRGFYKPPASRICVPGFNWTAVLISALGEVPSVCLMNWWTCQGKFKEWGGNIIYRMLKQMKQKLGRTVLHVLDRGYANTEMIGWFIRFEQDWLIRWKSTHLLINEQQQPKATHLLARGCKAQQSRLVWDKERKKQKRISIAWAAVRHPDHVEHQLTMIIVRDKQQSGKPMYLLTSLWVDSALMAWEICFSYFHRWNIEQAFRFGKSELAIESPRLWFWENRLKLLAIVALVYDFLLRLLRNWRSVCQILLRRWAHRTGNRYRKASIPVYRLRLAISNCLSEYLAQNSG